MDKQTILDRFNKEGIFPTDSELEILAETSKGTGGTLATFDKECELLDIASNNPTHPYHHKI